MADGKNWVKMITIQWTIEASYRYVNVWIEKVFSQILEVKERFFLSHLCPISGSSWKQNPVIFSLLSSKLLSETALLRTIKWFFFKIGSLTLPVKSLNVTLLLLKRNCGWVHMGKYLKLLFGLCKKLWKPGDEGFWKIWKRRFFQDIQNSFW